MHRIINGLTISFMLPPALQQKYHVGQLVYHTIYGELMTIVKSIVLTIMAIWHNVVVYHVRCGHCYKVIIVMAACQLWT